MLFFLFHVHNKIKIIILKHMNIENIFECFYAPTKITHLKPTRINCVSLIGCV